MKERNFTPLGRLGMPIDRLSGKSNKEGGCQEGVDKSRCGE